MLGIRLCETTRGRVQEIGKRLEMVIKKKRKAKRKREERKEKERERENAGELALKQAG